ncbi:endonuclease domain-containing 1 protein [Mauremys reevesii]|uniref:endonuclease domain-containing 1 protein n=1 Tax=Mauremys reevesii TaxID=260615 RepID=UPI001940048E|nr:endonuclease domain-containing 1 protein [Mauremys reevesii]
MKMSILFSLCIFAFPGFSQGRVVGVDEAGFAECNEFFYGETPPEGFTESFHVKICQQYNKEPRFATLYSTEDKTPLYSAFKYTKAAQMGEESWLVEPQIDDPGNDLEEMVHEAVAVGSVNNLGANQALTTDYVDSGYERGQLNPSSLNEDDFQLATYTLTNAVPMTPSLSKSWHKDVEDIVEQALAPHCKNEARLYLVAGAVPSSLRVKDKVSIPEFLWLAACCDAPEVWSVGFLKRPSGENSIEDLSVEELEKQLPSGAHLFKSNCGGGSQSQEKMEAILQTINQIQSEEPIVQTPAGRVGWHRDEQRAQEKPGEGSLLKRVAGIVAAPFTKLLRLVGYVLVEVVRYTCYFLWYIVKQLSNTAMGGLYSLWNGVMSYGKEISIVLVNIPRDVAKVAANIVMGFVRIFQNTLSLIYRIISVPIGLFLHIMVFPLDTLCAIPIVLKDIAAGVGGTCSLIVDATAAMMSGFYYIATHLGKKFVPKLSSDD